MTEPKAAPMRGMSKQAAERLLATLASHDAQATRAILVAANEIRGTEGEPMILERHIMRAEGEYHG